MRRLLRAAARRLRHAVSVVARRVGGQMLATVAQAWRDLTIIVTVLLMAALTAASVTHEHHVYEGAQHAFHNHTNRERYHETAAKQAWADALSWFSTHLTG